MSTTAPSSTAVEARLAQHADAIDEQTAHDASLARRARPRRFDDCVGQELAARMLRTVAAAHTPHHAYLLVGPRGTGKTTMARVFAAALNCPDAEAGEPCGTCRSCEAIARGADLDVVEIDAASHNKVEDARDLTGKVIMSAVGGRFRVFILDEAHMLTTQAWNALLKTLEEPPPRTVFILATTEAGKVLPTVEDRCHRINFRRPSLGVLSARIETIAQTEGITIDRDACMVAARYAQGSYRRALGALEQIVVGSTADQPITGSLASQILGTVDAKTSGDLFGAIVTGQQLVALQIVAEAIAAGTEPDAILRDLERHSREVLICCTAQIVPETLVQNAEHAHQLSQQATMVTAAHCVLVIDRIASALRAISDGADARVQLEVVAVDGLSGRR